MDDYHSLEYSSFEYLSDDGLHLFARDYTSVDGAPVVLCLHGLTRNSADFEPLCEVLASRYRLIVPDQRGRGRSQRDSDSGNYHPLKYNEDMLALLDALSLDRVHIIGTSMGGIMGMLLAAQQPQQVASLVLNDIGPEIDLEGVRMIAALVGRPRLYRDWDEAIEIMSQSNAANFPEFNRLDWEQFTRRLCVETAEGVAPAYDPAIGETFANAGDEAAPDLWAVFDQLADLPMLVIHGAMSNLLSAETCRRMQSRHPGLEVVQLANRGHAPILDEPPALAAIERFLLRHTDSQK